ncbi:MAG TPA: SulP family inorganic anion transporter [Planctomycetota bacterium]|nr:SulP family inorganic anion transporter [Planctomycetota bacterium]
MDDTENSIRSIRLGQLEPRHEKQVIQPPPTPKPAAAAPAAFLPNFTGGVLSALVTLSYSLSYGTLIFSGQDLQAHVPAGLQAALMAAWVIALIVALGSSFPFAIAGPDSNATAILALMAAFTVDRLAKRAASPESVVATVLALLLVTALIVGVVVYLIGFFRRGKLVRFLPYPVVGGFLAGTGYLILGGGFKVLTSQSLSFENIVAYGTQIAPQAWFPALVVAAGLFVVPRFQKNVIVMPAIIVMGVIIFYAGLHLSGMSIETARSKEFLFVPMQPAGVRQTALTSLGLVHWDILVMQWHSMLALILVVIITILLNASGLDLQTQTDADIDRELRVNGIANIVSGLFGGMIGYLSISRSLLNYKSGANARTAGLITAAICIGATFLFTPAVAYFPRPVLAGLLIFLGLSMLREWIWDAYFKIPLLEYELIVAILLLIMFQGLITGVGFGLLVASIFFVYSYSRTSCIKHNFNSAMHFSNKERSLEQSQLLRTRGVHARTLALQGYIFFGTSSEVVETCRALIEKDKLEYLLVDFRRVQGLDASAVSSFIKLQQLCRRYRTQLILSGLRPELSTEFKRTGFLPDDAIQVLPDMDRGMEFMEDSLLGTLGGVIYVPSNDPKLSGTQAVMDLRRILSPEFTHASLDLVIAHCETLKLVESTPLFKAGEPSDAMYFLERGELSVLLPLDGGQSKRLRSFGPGTVVGEMGLYTGQPRSADVVTSMNCRVRKLSADAIKKMEKEHPDAAIELHRFVVRLLSRRLVAANEEIRGLL